VPLRRWTERAVVAANRLRGRLPYQERCQELIARYAPGRSFLDVGCMWKVDGAYAFHALTHGAASVTGLDVGPATAEFAARNRASGGRVRFVQGDINDPATAARLGVADVVFCSGVLYHVPNPILTLERLRRLCRETLLLGCATIPEQAHPQSAIFLPFLPEAARAALTYHSGDEKVGLDSAFVPEWGYGNWFWGFTPSCVEAMAQAAGFALIERYVTRRSVCVVCSPTEGAPGCAE
jgi:SAM-dependent methyltransferase